MQCEKTIFGPVERDPRSTCGSGIQSEPQEDNGTAPRGRLTSSREGCVLLEMGFSRSHANLTQPHALGPILLCQRLGELLLHFGSQWVIVVTKQQDMHVCLVL